MHSHSDIVVLDPVMLKFDQPIRVDVVEKKYNAKFVGEFPARTIKGNWSGDFPLMIFYKHETDERYPNQYFGLHVDPATERVMISDGDYIKDVVFSGIHADNGVIYSRFRHDYIRVDGGMVDGGWDYFRWEGTNPVNLRVVDGIICFTNDEATVH